MSIIYGEIKDQHNAFEKCAAYIDAKFGDIRGMFDAKTRRIAFIGCGSSYSLAKSMAIVSSMRLDVPSVALAAGDLLLHSKRYARFLQGALIVPISRSGCTSEVLLALDALRTQDCAFRVLGISCQEQSELTKRSDAALEMPWCYDHSVCQTRTVSGLYYAVMYLIATLSDDGGLREELRRFSIDGARFMDANEDACQSAAGRGWTHGIVLADAEAAGIAEEGALAFKEICQLPSNHYNMLDFRHGPIVLAGEKTLVIALLSGDKREEDLICDIVKKGADVITVSDLPTPIDGTENFFFGEAQSQIARGLTLIAICQMITFYKSELTGADPDMPSGLDAWIKL